MTNEAERREIVEASVAAERSNLNSGTRRATPAYGSASGC
jgi:hypothetical protein